MQKSILSVSAAVCAVALALAAAPAANATITWDFSFSLSNGDTGSGTFLTGNTPNGSGYYTISSLTGSIDGNAMTLLAPGGTFNDNLISKSNPQLDGEGLGFVAEGWQWAIWSQGGATVDSWCNNATNGGDHVCYFATDPNGAVLSFKASPASVPEPAVWTLLISGIGLAGGALRRRRGSQVAA